MTITKMRNLISKLARLKRIANAHLQASIKDIIGDYRNGKDHVIVALRYLIESYLYCN